MIDERAYKNVIRPLTPSRKNFLFCGNHEAQKIRQSSIHCLPPVRHMKLIQKNS